MSLYQEVAKGRQTLLRDDLFAAYLPYAAGYGLVSRWAKQYQKQARVASPDWFTALEPGDSVAAFVAVMSASHASFSSGGGGASGATDASGAG